MEFNKGGEASTLISHELSELSKTQTQRSIYRVHKYLRNVNSQCYEPNIVAIGPYHSNKDNLKMTEEHKLRYLQLLLERKKENVERYTLSIGELEHEARSCYADPIHLNSAMFIKMLVLDACFIIELVRKRHKRDPTCKNDPIFKMGWIMNTLQRDIILFENEIPFFILRKLFDLIEGPNQYDKLIHRLSFFCHNLFPGGRLKYKTERSPEEIKHILDLVHGNWIPSIKEVNLNVDEVDRMREWRFIHSATELTNANVAFQKKLSDDFFKVEFDDGLMQMQPLTIEDRTECFFRNLIAYEQYFQDTQPNFVTDYVKLLDSLINSSEDIDILCKCEIIDNWLGDNEVVANIFNRLTLSVTGHQHFVYTDIFDKVNAHYGTRRNKAIATLRRDYFNSPWAYFSFLAALAILSLTVAQTVFSALQVF
ncbi:UNVERIFIED_CONTAM: hypothetical protein Scaly_1047700 [Sesamum calycinum]|uniref:Uncharacterized protein n=1 Tax=Sesamum calycinum TaxID=2727403 RepID=A0AAW2QLX2_9LAMI